MKVFVFVLLAILLVTVESRRRGGKGKGKGKKPGHGRMPSLPFMCEAPVTVCQGAEMTLKCDDDETIMVAEATYGDITCDGDIRASPSTCTDAGATASAQKLCDGKISCTFTANDATFTTSTCAADKAENLMVRYKCKDNRAFALYGETTDISCPTGTQIEITKPLCSAPPCTPDIPTDCNGKTECTVDGPTTAFVDGTCMEQRVKVEWKCNTAK
ncbi:unnamed protein product [Mytilus edulis]|uniref:SUEL-type lectin domain-containing protein n=1 Tax=Mytilus edulis TaxID=6550 RepID=A0A8S3QMC8_MYTED|nr:unnamed protein product [Mytilus edulis]